MAEFLIDLGQFHLDRITPALLLIASGRRCKEDVAAASPPRPGTMAVDWSLVKKLPTYIYKWPDCSLDRPLRQPPHGRRSGQPTSLLYRPFALLFECSPHLLVAQGQAVDAHAHRVEDGIAEAAHGGQRRTLAHFFDTPRPRRLVRIYQGRVDPGHVERGGEPVLREVRVEDATLVVELDLFPDGFTHPHEEGAVHLSVE